MSVVRPADEVGYALAASLRISEHAAVALLDRDGVIIAVHGPGAGVAGHDGSEGGLGFGVGASFPRSGEAAGDDVSVALASAVRRAIAGDLPYPLQVILPGGVSGGGPGTVATVVASRFGEHGECVGATVVRGPVAGPAEPAEPAEPAGAAGGAGGAGPAEPALALSRKVLASLAEAAPDGLLVTDSRGRIVHVNGPLEALSGYRAADLVGRPVDLLVPEASRATHHVLRERYQAAPRTRLMAEGRLLGLRRRDGAVVPVEIALRPGRLDGGEVVLAAVRDESARRAAEDRERLVTQALDAIGDGVVVLDPLTGRRRYANRSVLDRVGCSREELDQLPIGAPTSPEQQAEIRQAIRTVVSGAVAEVALDTCVGHRDGTSAPVEIRISRVPPAPGDPGPGAVVLISRDISERLAAQHRMRASEASFREVFERAPIAAAVLSVGEAGRDRRIVLANPALAELLGEPVSTLIGRDLAEHTLPDDAPAVLDLTQEDLRGDRGRLSQRTRWRRGDQVLWIDVQATVITLPGVPGPTLLAFLIDATAGQQAERERQQQAAVARLVADVATATLAGSSPDQAYQQIVEGTARLLEAQDVALGFVGSDGARSPVAATGPIGAALLDDDPPAGHARHRPGVPEAPDPLLPRAVARFPAGPDLVGLISVARPPGAPPFSDPEIDLLDDLVRQVALAIHLGQARVDRERLALLEERHRIARDLHDTVIQDIISVGMQLVQGLGGELRSGRRTHRDAAVAQLDHTVGRLRGTVLDLRRPAPDPGLAATVREVVADATRALGFPIALTCDGPLEQVPEPVAGQAAAALREALANVVRHSRASAATVGLRVSETDLTLVVEDDGQGIDRTRRAEPGHGLVNLAERARGLGGAFDHGPRRPSGTRLTWVVPLPGPGPVHPRPAGPSPSARQR